MLTRPDILIRVQEAVAACAGIDGATHVGGGTRLHHDLGGRPLCLLHVWAALEGAFGIDFTMLDMLTHAQRDGITIGDLADAVAAKLAQIRPGEVAA